MCLEPHGFGHASEFALGGGLVGRVTACGEAATVLQDAHVLVSPLIACGECHTCRAGAATVCPSRQILGRDCDGGLAQSVVCAGRWLTTLEGSLVLDGPIAALVAGPALRAYGLFCRAGVATGDVVIVLGHGPAAGVLVKLATARGCKVVFGLSTTADISTKLAQLDCQSRPQKLFVCDGKANLALATRIAQPASIIASGIGLGELDVALLHNKELSLFAQEFAHPDLIPELAALVVKKELDLGSFLAKDTTPEGRTNDDLRAQSQQAFNDGKCLLAKPHPRSAQAERPESGA